MTVSLHVDLHYKVRFVGLIPNRLISFFPSYALGGSYKIEKNMYVLLEEHSDIDGM